MILETNNNHAQYHRNLEASALSLNSEIQFEPDELDFNELGKMQMNSKKIEQISKHGRPKYEQDKTNRSTRNTETITKRTQVHHHQQQQHHNNNHHHHHHHKSNKLHLRYKPHHHHKEQQQRYQHNHQHYHSDHHQKQLKNETKRSKRFVASGADSAIPPVLYVETAIFVDSDLFKHMSKNFPIHPDRQLIRFVLAMINAVQLLYHDPSLGRRINFILKRLEILHSDPHDLRRSSDIDTYLSNFCIWQQNWNPPSDKDMMHYDHAVILTGSLEFKNDLDYFSIYKTKKYIIII